MWVFGRTRSIFCIHRNARSDARAHAHTHIHTQDHENADDFPNAHPVARVFKSMYLSVGGYFAGGAANSPQAHILKASVSYDIFAVNSMYV